MLKTKFDKKIGVIGIGRLGTALVIALQKAGFDVVGIIDSTEEQSQVLASSLGVKSFDDNYKLANSVDVLFITVPDQKIVPVYKELLVKDTLNRLSLTIFHCSGSMSAYDLPEDSNNNIARGSFHPLQSFASSDSSFENIFVAMDGDYEAVEIAKEICIAISANTLNIPPTERALYHAAACMASNHLVTLLSLAQDIFTRWTDNEKDAQQALLPLVQGTLANIEQLGIAKALTGPIARGDSQTIDNHLEILPGNLDCFYKVMSLYTLKLAAKNGSLSSEQAKAISEILQKQKES